MTKTFFLVEQGCSRMNTPPRLRFHLQMPFLYHLAGYIPVHFENNRVQLLPLYSMRKQSVYDSDWNFSYHPEPEESGYVMVTDFALEISLSSHEINWHSNKTIFCSFSFFPVYPSSVCSSCIPQMQSHGQMPEKSGEKLFQKNKQ